MAKLSSHGHELGRAIVKFNGRTYLAAFMSDGKVLGRTPWHGWKVVGRKKADIPLDQWVASKPAWFAGLPEWRRVRSIPTAGGLLRQDMDGIVDTPCEHGCRVEPDGRCEHGVPAWTRIFGLV